LIFTPAVEPTDIIWENRHFIPGFKKSMLNLCGPDAKNSVVGREIFGYSFVLIALSLSFLLILFLASLEIKFA
jgi:hypothetical protein